MKFQNSEKNTILISFKREDRETFICYSTVVISEMSGYHFILNKKDKLTLKYNELEEWGSEGTQDRRSLSIR